MRQTFERLESLFRELSRQTSYAVLVAGVFPLLIRALLLPAMPPPEPRVHDEFSHLLAADTFAHGRPANARHPFAMHFESPHVLVRPSYASVYPPAQGLMLAAGQAVFHHPWTGVWLSVGLMSAALCWALQGWLPPTWAFFGSLLFALRLGIFSYWMNSYWGGAPAALGGALVLGALPRMLTRRSLMASVWMALGLALLANSRPFEGSVYAILLLGVALAKTKTWPIVWPAILILAISGAAMSYYFARVTGDPLRMPYVLYRSQTSAPHFILQRPRPTPVFHHRELRNNDDWELTAYRTARTENMFVRTTERAQVHWRFFFSALFTIPLICLPWLWKERDARLLLIATGLFFLIALSFQVWQSPHYAAPATALFALLFTMALRRFSRWQWRDWPVGLAVARALPIATLLTLLLNTSARNPSAAGSRWAAWGQSAGPRAVIRERLIASGEKHLVMVRYTPQHDATDEWVYNGADIDGSQVIWSREMGPLRDGGLLRYFAGRRIWLAEPDADPPRISPYPVDRVKHPDVLRAGLLKARADVCEQEACPLTCEQWNELLRRTAGEWVDVDLGCTAGNARSGVVSFEHWFSWLQGEG